MDLLQGDIPSPGAMDLPQGGSRKYSEGLAPSFTFISAGIFHYQIKSKKFEILVSISGKYPQLTGKYPQLTRKPLMALSAFFLNGRPSEAARRI